jgi:spore coat polysaccharide biosynthesis predicted glycosyltransferase SpsG
LVRREFLPYRRPRGAAAGTLLVTLGGSDAGGFTETVLGAVAESVAPAFGRVVLLVGPAAPEPPAGAGVEVVRDPADVAAVLDRADAAVSAAGSTTWELLCLGVPCALLEVAPNQRMLLATVERAGAALTARSVADLPTAAARLRDAGVRAALGERARATVDGRGAARVVDELEHLDP